MPEAIDIMRSLIRAAMNGADPGRAVARAIKRSTAPAPTHMLAAGKASLGMAAAAMAACADVGECLVVGPDLPIPAALHNPRVRVLLADHPLPTARNVAAAREVRDFVSRLPKDASLLVLLSGGASSHLTLPAQGVTLDDIRAMTGALNRAGATIDELNTARKHCEQLKGGRLAAMCPAAHIRVLVMSDVAGDRLDVIGSGPFFPDTTTRADAVAVLCRHGVTGTLPVSSAFQDVQQNGIHGPEARATHEIIANNRTVLDAVAAEAQRLGLFVARDHQWLSGDAAAAGRRLPVLAVSHVARISKASPSAAFGGTALPSGGLCLIAGGEPTVNASGSTGTGGPSQELALAAALALDGVPNVMLAAISTDGVDGPTTHMGAIATGQTAAAARARGLDPAAALASHDSATFFAATHGALPGGATGMNLNHVVIAVVE